MYIYMCIRSAQCVLTIYATITSKYIHVCVCVCVCVCVRVCVMYVYVCVCPTRTVIIYHAAYGLAYVYHIRAMSLL